MSKGTWTGGRRRLKKEKVPIKETLVVSDSRFFAKRDKKNRLKENIEWSEELIKTVSERWECVLVFALNRRRSFDNIIKSLNISNIETFFYNSGSVFEITNQWKNCLIEHGAKIKKIKNPREISYLNIQKFIDAPHITWVNMNDHKLIDVEADKPLSFEELQEKRKIRSEW